MKSLFISGLLLISASLAHAEAAGDLIDQLIKKQLEAPQAITAESALPTKRESKVDATVAPVVPTAKVEENQQPVFNNPAAITAVKAEGPRSIWGRMLGSLAIALTIFGGGIFALKKWPNAAKKLSGRTKMIEILSQQYLGPKKSLAIIRVAGEAVLVGVTDNNITLLKTLSLLDDDIPGETKDAQFSLKKNEKQKFQNTLGAQFNMGATISEKVPSREDEFSMQGLKEIIGERLKSMKEI